MAVYNYSKYKIRIDSDSQKTQGLQVGDVVRRQYAERNQSIYTLMVVVETGIDAIDGKESPYFIGALLDGDEPKSGELLDFVRITSLTNGDRSGAMYLTASDSDAPYMDCPLWKVYSGLVCNAHSISAISQMEVKRFCVQN